MEQNFYEVTGGQQQTRNSQNFRHNSMGDGMKTPEYSRYSHRYPINTNSQIWNQSASTWRNSSNSFSFPKGDRFNSRDTNKRRIQSPDLNPVYHDLPTTKTTKFCTLGKGVKQYISNEQMKNAALIPQPGYTQDLYRSPQVKNIALGTQTRFSYHTPKNIPPVGTYEISKELGKDKPKFSFKDRIDLSNVFNKPQSPAPGIYDPNDVLTQNLRFTKISFGKGNKMDFSKNDPFIPPVGSYRTYSCFDKYKNIQMKTLPGFRNRNKGRSKSRILKQTQEQLNTSFKQIVENPN